MGKGERLQGMTRAEAINILDELSRTVTVAHSHENVEAVHMAITVLQQEEHLVELEAKAVAIIKSERHGEWLLVEGTTLQTCSECSFCMEIDNEADNFCPNCGAKMRGDKHEIDRR